MKSSKRLVPWYCTFVQLPVAVLSTSLTQQHKEADDEDDDHVQLHPAGAAGHGAAGQGRRPPLSETGDLHLLTQLQF